MTRTLPKDTSEILDPTPATLARGFTVRRRDITWYSMGTKAVRVTEYFYCQRHGPEEERYYSSADELDWTDLPPPGVSIAPETSI